MSTKTKIGYYPWSNAAGTYTTVQKYVDTNDPSFRKRGSNFYILISF